MADDSGKLKFVIELDNSQVTEGAQESKKSIEDLASSIEAIGKKMDVSMSGSAKSWHNFESEAKQVSGAISDAWSKLDKAMEDNDKEITRLQDQYGQLKKSIADALASGNKNGNIDQLHAQSAAVRNELAKRQQINKELVSQADQLTHAEKQLADAEAKHAKVVQSQSVPAENNLRTQMREVRMEMAGMLLAARQSGDPMAEAAVRASKAYQDLEEKAALMQDTMGDIGAQTRILAHDNSGLQGVISGVSGVAGAFSVAQGVMGLFSQESEDLQKVMLKVQSVMAVTMGLQQVMNTLNKDSAFSLGIVAKFRAAYNAALLESNAATTVNTASEVANTSATNANAGASTKAAAGKEALTGATVQNTAANAANTGSMAKGATATASFGTRIKALGSAFKALASPAGAVIAVIGALLGALVLYIRHATKAEREMKKIGEEARKSVAAQATSLKSLKNQWDKLSTISERTNFLKKNKEELEKLGIAIRNVNEAENFFANHTGTYINALIARAKATAVMKTAEEKMAKLIKYEDELNQHGHKDENGNWVANTVVRNMVDWVNPKTGMTTYKQVEMPDPAFDAAKKKYDELDAEMKELYDKADKYIKEAENLEEESGVVSPEEAAERKRQEEEAKKRAKELADTKRKLQEDALKQDEAYANKIEDESRKLYFDLQQAEIDGMKEGYAKKMAQIKLNFEKEMAEISRERNEFLRAAQDRAWAAYLAAHPGEKDNIGKEKEIKNAVTLDQAADDILSKKEQQATERKNKAEADANRELMEELIQEYGDFVQKRKKIDEEYEADRATIAEKGDAKMLKKRERKYKKALSDLAKASLDSDTWTKFFDNADKLTIAEINQLLDELAEGANSSNEAIKNLSQEAIEDLTKQLTDLKTKVEENNPFAKLSAAIKQFKEDSSETNFNNMLSALGELQQTVQPLIDSLGNLFNAMTEGDEAAQRFTGTISSMLQGATQGGWIGAIVSGIVSVITTMVDVLTEAIKDWRNRPFKDWEKDVEETDKRIEKLQKDSEKLFGQSLVDNYKKQFGEVNDMIGATDKAMREYEEKAKKRAKREGRDYDETDPTKYMYEEQAEHYNELKDKLEEYRETQKDLEEAMAEAIYGETISSAIQRFESAYSEAWASGTSAAETSANLISDTFKQMASEMAKDALESGKFVSSIQTLAKSYADLKQARESGPAYIYGGKHGKIANPVIYATYEASGLANFGVTYEDFVSMSADQLRAKIQEIANLAGEEVTSWYNSLDDVITTENERNASAQGIATASQESVDELNGRMTAVQGHTFNISENSNILRDNVQAILGSVQQIELNTRAINSMANDISFIKQNGIQLYN